MNNLPYVYKCVHRETGKFYIGSRWANKVSAIDDLGILYFTSSKFVKPIHDEFNFAVLSEFNTKEEAYAYEQTLIREVWGSELLINKRVTLTSEDRKYKFLSSMKGNTNRRGKVSWNKGNSIKVECVCTNCQAEFTKYPTSTQKYCSYTCAKTNIPGRPKGTPSQYIGVPLSKTTRERMKLNHWSKNGGLHGMKNKNHSEETKRQMKQSMTNRHVIRVSCICCRVEYDLGNYSKHIKLKLRSCPS